jgi:hypothetical protein
MTVLRAVPNELSNENDKRRPAMNVQEIVGAIVNSVTITTDPARIDASKAFGHDVHYITRTEAERRALTEKSQHWVQLAIARTLFLCNDGALFRCNLPC